MENLINELNELRTTLKADGYKDWCYAQLTIDKAINAIKKCNLAFVSNCAILETMHQRIFDEFHNLRATKGNPRYVTIDGKIMNELIRVGKLVTKKEHGC